MTTVKIKNYPYVDIHRNFVLINNATNVINAKIKQTI